MGRVSKHATTPMHKLLGACHGGNFALDSLFSAHGLKPWAENRLWRGFRPFAPLPLLPLRKSAAAVYSAIAAHGAAVQSSRYPVSVKPPVPFKASMSRSAL